MFRIDPEESLGSFAERVLEAAAANVKDLAAENLYIVNQPLARSVAACFGPGQDRMWEEEIANAGKWSGRGICLLADFAKIYGGTFAYCRAAGIGEAESDRLARGTLAGKILHELAHGIERGREGEARILSDGIDAARLAFQRVFVDDEQPAYVTAAAAPVEPWNHHDLPFIRCCALIHSRVTPYLPVDFGDIVEPSNYGLAEGKWYYKAMQADGDFAIPRTVPIRTIIARAAGPVLTARWRQDVFQWYKTLPQATDAHTQAALKALALCNGRQAKAEAVPVAAASDDYLPQPFEHFYEMQTTPENFLHDSFRSETVADGIRRMVAQPRDGGDGGDEESAAYYFDCNLFTLPEATGWMNAHGIPYAHCVPAKNATYPQLTS